MSSLAPWKVKSSLPQQLPVKHVLIIPDEAGAPAEAQRSQSADPIHRAPASAPASATEAKRRPPAGSQRTFRGPLKENKIPRREHPPSSEEKFYIHIFLLNVWLNF